MVSQVVIVALQVELEFWVMADLSVVVNFQVMWQVFLSDNSHLSNVEVIETHLFSRRFKPGDSLAHFSLWNIDQRSGGGRHAMIWCPK